MDVSRMFIFLVKIRPFSSKLKKLSLKEKKLLDLETNGWLEVLLDIPQAFKLRFLRSERILLLTKMKVFMLETPDPVEEKSDSSKDQKLIC